MAGPHSPQYIARRAARFRRFRVLQSVARLAHLPSFPEPRLCSRAINETVARASIISLLAPPHAFGAREIQDAAPVAAGISSLPELWLSGAALVSPETPSRYSSTPSPFKPYMPVSELSQASRRRGRGEWVKATGYKEESETRIPTSVPLEHEGPGGSSQPFAYFLVQPE